MPRPMVVMRRARARTAVLDACLATLLWALDLLVSWRPDEAGGQPGWVVPVYAAVGYSALAVRRRYPRAVLAVLVLQSVLAAALFPNYLPTLGVWLALYTVAARCDLASATAGLVAALIPAALNVADAVDRQLPSDRTNALVGTAVALTLFNITIFGVGRWARWSVRQRRLVAEAAMASATAQERARIARDLHDVVAHAVTLMLLQAGGAARLVRTDPGRAEEALGNVDTVGQQAIVELRRLLGLLLVEDDPARSAAASVPALERLDELLNRADAAGLHVRLEESGGSRPLEPGVDTAAFRIIQEALTNATRYTPRPGTATVSLRWSPTALEITVVNTPAKHQAPPTTLSTGHGLILMRERARSAGGTLAVGPDPNGTFIVQATLPTVTDSSAAALEGSTHA